MAAPNWRAASEGQTAALMYCACNNPGTLVRTAMADQWRCSLCKKGWPSGENVTLGPDGALPAPAPTSARCAA